MLESRLFYENPDGFDSRIVSYWADFLENTVLGRASRTFINLDEETSTRKNPLGIPEATRSYVYTRGLQETVHQIDHVKEGRKVLDRQDVDVYAFDYTVYGLGGQHENLPVETVKAIAISMAVATMIMMPLILHSWTAILVSSCVLLAVLLAAGTTSWTTLNFNHATYLALVITVGFCVEFCAHIARAFMLAPGSRLTRTLHALRTMGIAVFNGGVTTFLGVLPSAFSEFPNVRDLSFVQISIIVLAGLFMGLIFLPLVLTLFGPPSFEPIKTEVFEPETETVEEKSEKEEEP